MLVGRAQVVTRNPTYEPAAPGATPPPRVRTPMANRWRVWKRGSGWTVTAASFAVLCWIVWAASSRSTTGIYLAPTVFLSSLIVAFGVFVVLRLVGRLVIEGWMHRRRATARWAHIGTAVFLYAVGVTYLQQTQWIMHLYKVLKGS